MAAELASPNFLSLLLNHKESVIVIEDAEQIVQARGNGGDDSTVSSILNMSDGLLANVLSVSFILSLNAPENTIDRAILRKGRLAYKNHFGPLNTEDAKRLSKHLNKDVEVKEPMTLAEIYGAGEKTNISDEPSAPKVPEVGFHTLLTPISTLKK